MQLIKTLNPEDATEQEIASFKTRTAARAVVYDNDGHVAILNVSNKNYHKLPGGGVEDGEDELSALKRECREELGCEIEVFGEVGQIVEYRKIFHLKQISLCYLANVTGQKGSPAFTQDETEDGFQILWLPIQQAMQILADDQPENDEGRLYIVPRDMTFLEAANIQHNTTGA